MLVNFENRKERYSENVWMGRYVNLINILHWHLESEIICIVEGTARIMIDGVVFNAKKGDCFFCRSNVLHYIECDADGVIDVLIFNNSVLTEELRNLSPTDAHISDCDEYNAQLNRIRQLIMQKPSFYSSKISAQVISLMSDIFCNNPTQSEQSPSVENDLRFYKRIVKLINESYSSIDFDTAAKFSGYSPAYFSRLFKKLSGMSFSEYLNFVRIEKAITFMKEDESLSVSTVAHMCGFDTIRNFNRVFKQTTGYTPTSLPTNYRIHGLYFISDDNSFDPTDKKSELLT